MEQLVHGQAAPPAKRGIVLAGVAMSLVAVALLAAAWCWRTAAKESAPAAAESAAPLSGEALVTEWHLEDGKCRGSTSPESPATIAACERRSLLDAKLETSGWCYGRPGQFGYQVKWELCSSQQVAERPPPIAHAPVSDRITLHLPYSYTLANFQQMYPAATCRGNPTTCAMDSPPVSLCAVSLGCSSVVYEFREDRLAGMVSQLDASDWARVRSGLLEKWGHAETMIYSVPELGQTTRYLSWADAEADPLISKGSAAYITLMTMEGISLAGEPYKNYYLVYDGGEELPCAKPNTLCSRE